jgi:hypothetical protein
MAAQLGRSGSDDHSRDDIDGEADISDQQCVCRRCHFIPPHIEERLVKYYESIGDSIMVASCSEDCTLSVRLRESRSLAVLQAFQRLTETATQAVGALPPLSIIKKINTTIPSFSVVSAGGTDNIDGLPGNPILSSDAQVKAAGDQSMSEAYYYAKDTYRLFKEIFNRDSIDNHGCAIDSTVHFGRRYNNAFWNGERMTYGDGDGIVFNRFTSDIDVIGHELAHGVTEHTVGFLYRGQSGALNEHLSDVFGSLLSQYKLNQNVYEADWLIGNDLIKPMNGRTFALRSIKAPGHAHDGVSTIP